MLPRRWARGPGCSLPSTQTRLCIFFPNLPRLLPPLALLPPLLQYTKLLHNTPVSPLTTYHSASSAPTLSAADSKGAYIYDPVFLFHPVFAAPNWAHNPQVAYTYVGSFLFSSHSKAQNLWLFHNFLLGVLGPIAVFFIQDTKKRDTALFFMRFFPQICLAYPLMWLGFSNVVSDMEGDDDFFGSSFDPFSEPVRVSLIYMACEAVGYTGMVLLLERCDLHPRHLKLGCLVPCMLSLVKSSGYPGSALLL